MTFIQMFSLGFDNRFNTIDWESLEMKENDTVVEADNTINRASKRTVLTETTITDGNKQTTSTRRFQVSSQFKRANSRNPQSGRK